jgi:threonine/homoserine/homoserine lactone efflux protein
MPTAGTIAVFAVATLALIAIPGPSTFYLLGRGIAHGRRVAFISALGVETGSVLFVCLTAFGLSVLIASSAYAFSLVHYLGVAYLFFLGWRTLREHTESSVGAKPGPRAYWASYRQGFLVGASNPKVALFFLAFFPQFVRPDRGSTTTQVLVLGAVFVALGLTADAVNSCASGAIGAWLARRSSFLRARRYVEASSYFALGSWALVSGSARSRR